MGLALWSRIRGKSTELCNQGAAKAIKGDYEGAIVDFTRAIELDPKQASAFRNRGLARVLLKQYDEALADFERAEALGAADADLYEARGRALFSKDMYAEAVAALTKAIELDPKGAQGYALRARSLLNSGKAAEALPDADRAVALDPADAEHRVLRSLVLRELRRFDEALKDADAALEVDPKNVRGLLSRAKIREAFGDREGALADLDRLKQTGEVDQETIELFRSVMGSGRRADPVAEASRAIRLNPNDRAAYRRRGTVRLERGEWREAVEDLTKFIEGGEGGCQTYLLRAKAHRALGDDAGASADISIALEHGRETEETETKYGIGCALFDEGRAAEALSWFSKCGDRDYAHLRTWLIRTRAGEGEAAANVMRIRHERKVDRGEVGWASKLTGYACGRISEEEVVLAIHTMGGLSDYDRGQGHLYVGCRRLLAGDRDRAAAAFRDCLKATSATSDAYQSALVELKRLGAGR